MSSSDNAGPAGIDEAAGLLRLALPLMSRHQVPVTPYNYAVWYRYVAGTDDALKRTIDERVASGEPFTVGFNDRLYRRFVLDVNSDTLEAMRRSVLSLLDGLVDSVDAADAGMDRYVEQLGDAGSQLDRPLPQSELVGLVRTLAAETRAARESGVRLQASLVDHRKDSDDLRAEILRLRSEATTDALTGLANRRALMDALDEARVVDGEPSSFSIVFADIDHFKSINDRYGHLLGDKVLRYVASVLKRSVKGRDTVARYGGEEFVLVLPETPYEGAMTLAAALRSAVESGRLVRSDTRERIGSVTVSFGVATWRCSEDLDELLTRADACLYQAKQQGRNRVVGERDVADPAVARAAVG